MVWKYDCVYVHVEVLKISVLADLVTATVTCGNSKCGLILQITELSLLLLLLVPLLPATFQTNLLSKNAGTLQ